MSSSITEHKGLKSKEVLKPPFRPSRMSVRSKGSSEESENRTKAFKNFCRIFIEMIFTQVIVPFYLMTYKLRFLPDWCWLPSSVLHYCGGFCGFDCGFYQGGIWEKRQSCGWSVEHHKHIQHSQNQVNCIWLITHTHSVIQAVERDNTKSGRRISEGHQRLYKEWVWWENSM